MKYINTKDTSVAAKAATYKAPQILYIKDINKLIKSGLEYKLDADLLLDDDLEFDSFPDYLTFTSTGTSGISMSNSSNTPNIEYSLDEGETWTSWDYSNINLSDGDVVKFRGNNENGFSTGYFGHNSRFVMTGSLAASGNIMSLIDGEKDGTKVIPSQYCFVFLFDNCSALTSAPKLPATTVQGYCYQSMFNGCTCLTKAPVLPAKTGQGNCYAAMFNGCSNLSYIKCMLEVINGGTLVWIAGVSSSGTFVRPASSASIWSSVSGNDTIPSGWTVQDA